MEPLSKAIDEVPAARRWQVMPYHEALATLHHARRVFIAADTLRDALARVPDVGDAVLAFMRCVFDRVAHPDGAEPPPPEIWDLVGALLRNLDDAQVADLLVDVLFRAPDPAIYRALAPGLRGRVPARVAEAEIVMHLALTRRRQRRNALHLARALFDGRRDYRLSDAGRQAVRAAIRLRAGSPRPARQPDPA
jgi:hypothetical protein